MKVDLSQPIQIDPADPKKKSPAKHIAMQALWGVSKNEVPRDKAKQLYQKLESSGDVIDLPLDDFAIINICVDAWAKRGVAWQFDNILND